VYLPPADPRPPPRTIWRVLAVLGGLLLGAVWFIGSGLALGLAECPVEATAGLCAARHEDLLAALEAAIVLAGTIIAPAGGVLTARRGRLEWLACAVMILALLGFCADLLLAGQEANGV
jgi:hypothetical protein